MIISHSKQFIFIHVYKNAGTSMRAAFRSYNYRKGRKNRLYSTLGMYPNVYADDFDGHIKAAALRQQIPALFAKYFTFAFVRNPWAWQVSMYHFMQQRKDHWQHEQISKMSFDEYIDWRIHEDLHLQKEFVCDEDGQVIIDFIGKVEQIDRDTDHICQRLGITGVSVPRANTSKHKDYKAYYSAASQALVSEAFKEDIELFNYQFDS